MNPKPIDWKFLITTAWINGMIAGIGLQIHWYPLMGAAAMLGVSALGCGWMRYWKTL